MNCITSESSSIRNWPLNIGIYLVIGLAIITFIWNVYLYFFTEKDRTEAGMYVLYSVIGFFVILSFWGLVAILRNSLKLNDRAPSFPGFNQTGTWSGGTTGVGVRYDNNPFNTNASNPNPSIPAAFPTVDTQEHPYTAPTVNTR